MYCTPLNTSLKQLRAKSTSLAAELLVVKEERDDAKRSLATAEASLTDTKAEFVGTQEQLAKVKDELERTKIFLVASTASRVKGVGKATKLSRRVTSSSPSFGSLGKKYPKGGLGGGKEV